MTDGTEYQSDPETQNVRPLSGTSTPLRKLPPPLPARGLRPVIARNDSSTSHYSDAQDGPATGYATPPLSSVAPAAAQAQTSSASKGQVPVDGPPGYELEQGGSVAGGYPTEKGAFTDEPAPYTEHAAQGTSPSIPLQQEAMTVGERLEWEQYHADQQLAEQANRLDLNHGAAQHESESLR
jgi:hypothetical protein